MKKRRILVLVTAFIIGMVVIISLGLYFRNAPNTLEDEEINSVSITRGEDELVVSRDGSVVYRTRDGVSLDQWSIDKTDALFSYFENNYQGDSQLTRASDDTVTIVKGGKTYTYILDDDEIVDVVGGDVSDPDDTGGGGDTGDLTDYFPTNTPVPTSPAGGSNPTPTPGGGGLGECLYWKLSYCVIARTPIPTPTPVGTADPNANVIDAPDCGQWIEGGEFRPTIISNTLCLPTPTPTP